MIEPAPIVTVNPVRGKELREIYSSCTEVAIWEKEKEYNLREAAKRIFFPGPRRGGRKRTQEVRRRKCRSFQNVEDFLKN